MNVWPLFEATKICLRALAPHPRLPAPQGKRRDNGLIGLTRNMRCPVTRSVSRKSSQLFCEQSTTTREALNLTLYLVSDHGDARLLHGGASYRSERRGPRRLPRGTNTAVVFSPLGRARRPGFRHRSSLCSRLHRGRAGRGAPLLTSWEASLLLLREMDAAVHGNGRRLGGEEMGTVAPEVQRKRFARLLRACVCRRGVGVLGAG